MKEQLYNILKARFLIYDDASNNWRFIVYVIVLAIIMIANTHHFEKKVYLINELGNKTKELRSEFVEFRSELMQLKMESTISGIMKEKRIYPSSVPPQKIKVLKKKTWFEKLWK